MTRHISQSRQQLTQEIEFWRDFIQWWEQKNGHPAGQRIRAALAAAEERFRATDTGPESVQQGNQELPLGEA